MSQGLRYKLEQGGGSPYSSNNGGPSHPNTSTGANSGLHNEYSLNSNPNPSQGTTQWQPTTGINDSPDPTYYGVSQQNLPTPSLLDLDGITPPKYEDNPPT